MTISIIIAVKTWQKNLEECADKCLKLSYRDFEIIILPDTMETIPVADALLLKGPHPVKFIPTGPVNPAEKRDIAISHASGEILAFIDDDAHPEPDWLNNASVHFKNEDVAAVCGPAVTPLNDSLRQKASGLIYSCALVSGKFTYRYFPKKAREVDDYPTCNLLVRRDLMQKLGGFNTRFWPGEDTKLCLEITKNLKKKIIYDPAVLVWHHRRPVFIPHLKQIASYALHRGYFVKRLPQTSFRFPFFIPTIFLLFLVIGGALSLFSPTVKTAYSASLIFYFLLVFICSISKDLRLIFPVFLGIIFSHATYGFFFIKGLLSSSLSEESQ